MSDIEAVIKASKRYESYLESVFDAQGKGLHEKLTSVEQRIEPAISKKIRLVASVRNKLVHDSSYKDIDDRDGFFRICNEIDEYFLLTTLVDSDSRKCNDNNNDPYIEPSWSCKEIISGRIKPVEVVSEWEGMTGRRFIPTQSCLEEINKWLMRYANESAIKPAISDAVRYMHSCHYSENGVLPSWYVHTTVPSSHLNEIHIAAKKRLRKEASVKEVSIGIDENGNEAIRLIHVTPWIEKGIISRFKITKRTIVGMYYFNERYDLYHSVFLTKNEFVAGKKVTVTYSSSLTPEAGEQTTLTVVVPPNMSFGDRIRFNAAGAKGMGDLYVEIFEKEE